MSMQQKNCRCVWKNVYWNTHILWLTSCFCRTYNRQKHTLGSCGSEWNEHTRFENYSSFRLYYHLIDPQRSDPGHQTQLKTWQKAQCHLLKITGKTKRLCVFFVLMFFY